LGYLQSPRDTSRQAASSGQRHHSDLRARASMTWKRQPLDTHLFSVLKKKYQAYYYDRVFVENTPMKQIDTIYAYNSLMLNINKNHIVSAFQEAILNDAKLVPSIHQDPNPKMEQPTTLFI
jgi:hypothetical protein